MKNRIVFLWVLILCFNCSTISIIPEPYSGSSPGLAFFGMVRFLGKTTFIERDPFAFTTYRKDFFLFQEVQENQDGTIFSVGPSFSLTNNDVAISETGGIYFGITSFPVNRKYAMIQYGYMETRSSGSGANRVTYSVPVYFQVSPEISFPLLPIHIEEGKAKFVGVIGISESGTMIDGLQYIIEQGFDEDWNQFFGPYETTKKGAAWFLRDKVLTYQPDGYWTGILKKTEEDKKLTKK